MAKAEERVERLAWRLEAAWDVERGAIRFDRKFEAWGERCSSIGRFNDVEELISWHREEEVTYEETNPVTVALCLLAQEGDQATAALLYFLFIPFFRKALWNWRKYWDFEGPFEIDEIFDEMLGGFAEGMLTVKPDSEAAARHVTGKARAAVTNLIRRRLRREKREPSLEDIAENNVAILGVSEFAADPDTWSEWALVNAAVRENVLREREADLIRAEIAGYDLEETAQIFGTTYTAAAKMRLRAKGAMGAWLLEREVPPRRKTPKRGEIVELPALLTTDGENSQEKGLKREK